jgi:hypothetical protein
MTEFGREGVTGFNLYSMLVAIGGLSSFLSVTSVPE